MNCSVADCRHAATTALAIPAHIIPSSSGAIGGIGGAGGIAPTGQPGSTPEQQMEHPDAVASAAGTDATSTGTTTGSAGVRTAGGTALISELLEHASARQLCRQHGRQARREAVRLYLVQLRIRWAQLGEAEARVSSAQVGAAALEDVVFLDGCVQLLAAVAQVVECENDLAWKQAAAAAEQRREVLAKLLAQHVF